MYIYNSPIRVQTNNVVFIFTEMQRRDVGHAAVFQIIDFRLVFFRPEDRVKINAFSNFPICFFFFKIISRNYET